MGSAHARVTAHKLTSNNPHKTYDDCNIDKKCDTLDYVCASPLMHECNKSQSSGTVTHDGVDYINTQSTSNVVEVSRVLNSETITNDTFCSQKGATDCDNGGEITNQNNRHTNRGNVDTNFPAMADSVMGISLLVKVI